MSTSVTTPCGAPGSQVSELGVGGFMTAADVARRYAGESAPPPADEDPRTFGHVLVDEAQDLSPMQWRMLARRCPSGSLTVVGDFGQSSRPGAASGWDEVLSLLPERMAPRMVTLSVNYRTPAEVMDVAHRVLAAAAPGVPETRAVRRTGEMPRFVRVDESSLVSTSADAARAVAGSGTAAVVADAALHPSIVDELSDIGALAGTVDALDAPVAVLTPMEIKGLEFDHVVVVEPARLVTADSAGLRLLYVSLTRTTRSLTVVHAESLPEALAAGAATLDGAPVAAS